MGLATLSATEDGPLPQNHHWIHLCLPWWEQPQLYPPHRLQYIIQKIKHRAITYILERTQMSSLARAEPNVAGNSITQTFHSCKATTVLMRIPVLMAGQISVGTNYSHPPFLLSIFKEEKL